MALKVALPCMALCFAVYSARSIAPMLKIGRWALIFLAPLAVIHGILNPGYAPTFHVWSALPLRREGFEFAASISLSLVCLFTPAILLAAVPRRDLASLALDLGLPPMIALAIFQALSIQSQIEDRARAILFAQEARGIQTEGSILVRFRALAVVLIPLVVHLLLEARTRSTLQFYQDSIGAATTYAKSGRAKKGW